MLRNSGKFKPSLPSNGPPTHQRYLAAAVLCCSLSGVALKGSGSPHVVFEGSMGGANVFQVIYEDEVAHSPYTHTVTHTVRRCQVQRCNQGEVKSAACCVRPHLDLMVCGQVWQHVMGCLAAATAAGHTLCNGLCACCCRLEHGIKPNCISYIFMLCLIKLSRTFSTISMVQQLQPDVIVPFKGIALPLIYIHKLLFSSASPLGQFCALFYSICHICD